MKNVRGIITLLGVVAAILLADPACTSAQTEKENSVEATASIEPATLAAGGQGRLRIKLALADGAHVNANVTADPNLIPTLFTPKPVAGITWGKPEYPEPATVTEWYAVDPLSVFRDGAIITVLFTVDKGVTAGQLTIGGLLQAQACDHEQCYPARRITLAVKLEIQGSVRSETVTLADTIPVEAPVPAKPSASVNLGEHVPDFEFRDFTGKSRRFSEFRGRIVLIDFWATWCGPCLADIPKLKELYRKHRATGFDILGMDAETVGDEAETPDPAFARETHERAKQIVSTRGVTWTQATSDTAVPVALKVFGVKSLPTKILIGRDGKVIAKIGAKDDLEKIVGEQLAAK